MVGGNARWAIPAIQIAYNAPIWIGFGAIIELELVGRHGACISCFLNRTCRANGHCAQVNKANAKNRTNFFMVLCLVRRC